MSFGSEEQPRPGELWLFRADPRTDSKELRWPTRPGYCAILTLFGGDSLTVISRHERRINGVDELRFVFLKRGLHGWNLTGQVLWSTLFWNGMRRLA